ncbi:hypothetical protein [Butyrivibrio sp.]|uniref:hypothetical protein n=1 Tax=Butyrivibrio sp. TaxID=28121 RepID=UPI0025C01A99|nr:hypothetical protein [Butyrivibrio sp.]MBQ7430236.1 hypothetical protein [Butyrivibrio sp.]MBQ9303410.1 hypothetical protein [Butyrivibrio sp.]
MRSVYDFTGTSYRAYAQAKRDKDPLVSKMAALTLTGYGPYQRLENALTFMPYFVALEGARDGNKKCTKELIAERLEKAKKNIRKSEDHKFIYPYEDGGLKWEMYRPYDENYCSYDNITYKAIVDHKLTQEEEKELREALYVEFHDPYCDGRDCTGAPFTGYLQFLRCSDRTIVLHHVNFDV